jgi:lipoate-protein ligase A
MKGRFPSSWRLLTVLTDDGFRHMSLDHALLLSSQEDGFPPTLRFYRWKPPCLSLGRFQPPGDVDWERCRREGVDVVRRPTGGKAILHLDDFTYSIVLPPRCDLPGSVVEAYAVVCTGIREALSSLGLETEIATVSGGGKAPGSGACFSTSTMADLRCNGRKICGSAQVRHAGGVLQHGSLLLRDNSSLFFRLLAFPDEKERENARRGFVLRSVTLEETGVSVNWGDLADAFVRGFRRAFGVRLEEGKLEAGESNLWAALEREYRTPSWTREGRMTLPQAPGTH